MIRFSLNCASNHHFEAWFRNNDDFDQQLKSGFVTCPQCGSQSVQKALMAPSVSTGRKKEQIAVSMDETQKKILNDIQDLARKVRENADYVGDKFAEEARKIHYGETEQRGIYGEATADDVTSLVDEGIEIMPLPALPEDKN